MARLVVEIIVDAGEVRIVATKNGKFYDEVEFQEDEVECALGYVAKLVDAFLEDAEDEW